jgi:hypothetical protein
MLLITGHQRSGTGYMAALCRSMGLDVGHERHGEDGISSFQYAVDTDKVIFHSVDDNRGRKFYKFDEIIHVVRHPLHVIASTAFTDMNGAIEWQAGFIPVTAPKQHNIRRAVQTWLGWNELVEKQTDVRVRVEDAEEELPKILNESVVQDPPPPCVNARPHESLQWARVATACVGDEFPRLWQMAERYGYGD